MNEIPKKGFVLFLLWLRIPLTVLLSVFVALGFLGLIAVPIAVSMFEMSWTKGMVHVLISSFVLSFGSFLFLVFYNKLIQWLS